MLPEPKSSPGQGVVSATRRGVRILGRGRSAQLAGVSRGVEYPNVGRDLPEPGSPHDLLRHREPSPRGHHRVPRRAEACGLTTRAWGMGASRCWLRSTSAQSVHIRSRLVPSVCEVKLGILSTGSGQAGPSKVGGPTQGLRKSVVYFRRLQESEDSIRDDGRAEEPPFPLKPPIYHPVGNTLRYLPQHLSAPGIECV